jgi:hypothetical protein
VGQCVRRQRRRQSGGAELSLQVACRWGDGVPFRSTPSVLIAAPAQTPFESRPSRGRARDVKRRGCVHRRTLNPTTRLDRNLTRPRPVRGRGPGTHKEGERERKRSTWEVASPLFRAWRGELGISRFRSRYTLISFLVRWFSVGLFTSFDFYIARIGYGLSCLCWEEEEGLELVRFYLWILIYIGSAMCTSCE